MLHTVRIEALLIFSSDGISVNRQKVKDMSSAGFSMQNLAASRTSFERELFDPPLVGEVIADGVSRNNNA